MSVTIGSNISSLGIQRRLSENTSKLSQVFERLSSGLRINRASDDAAGLAIADNLRTDSRVYTQGLRNANDGISVLSIAQGALQELSAVIIRQTELAEQAANGVYSLPQRKALHAEANALVDEFNRIVSVTSFNGVSILDGSMNDLRIQLGYGNEGSIRVAVGNDIQRNSGTGEFNQSAAYTGGSTLNQVDAVDVNRDGVLDLITGNTTAGSRGPIILLGNSDGTFKAPVTLGGAEWSSEKSFADLNGDGNIDIIDAVGAGSVIRVYLGNGNGTFKASVSYTASGDRRGGAIGDLNGDGIVDFISGTSSPADGLINVFLGNGDGTFRAYISYDSGLGSNINSVAIADINNDGRNEVIATLGSGNTVQVLSTNSSGTLSLMQNIGGAGGPRELVAKDFNEDGYIDFAEASDSSGKINVFLNNGDGTFKAFVSYSPGAGATTPSVLRLADMDGDGKYDLVSNNAAGVSVLFGNGDGSFRLGITTAITQVNFDIGDFNRDGAIDVVSAQSGGAVLIETADTVKTSSIGRLYLLSREGALEALNTTTTILDRINLELGAIGAHQARLEISVKKLASEKETFLNAESKIRDADISQESSELIKQNILQQAGAAVLAQANLSPRLALGLLSVPPI